MITEFNRFIVANNKLVFLCLHLVLKLCYFCLHSELSVEGNLSHFKTPDLCIVSKLVTTEYVKNNSEDGCIVKNDKDLSLVYTLDGFR